jgi:carboxylate-amine ligase
LLALSSNSPFWIQRNTGLKSYRTIVWRSFPRSGIPPIFTSPDEFNNYVDSLILHGCIDNARKIWWDIRPHPFFDTIEFRVFDMPATSKDSIAIAALCQALVAKLYWLYKHNMQTIIVPNYLVEENKWRAVRYGMDAMIVDFTQKRLLSMRQSIHELFDFVDDVLDDLDTRCEINYLRSLVDDPLGTGAERQLAAYKQTGNIQSVIEYLMQESRVGLPLNSAL